MTFLTVTAILLLAAGASPEEGPIAVRPNATPSQDVTKIYQAFLETWNGKERRPINVSKSVELPTSSEIQSFSQCLNEKDTKNPTWARGTPIAELSGVIGRLPYVHFVDPKTWHAKDPADLISKGQSIESAVDAGFSGGLLTLSAVSFDSSQRIAAFTYSFVCGELCGNGGVVIFRKTSEGWLQSTQPCGGWIS